MSSEIVFVKGKLNAVEYQEMLHDELLPFITEIGDQKTIFQEDNAPIHTAAIIETSFQDFGIEFRESRRGWEFRILENKVRNLKIWSHWNKLKN